MLFRSQIGVRELNPKRGGKEQSDKPKELVRTLTASLNESRPTVTEIEKGKNSPSARSLDAERLTGSAGSSKGVEQEEEE